MGAANPVSFAAGRLGFSQTSANLDLVRPRELQAVERATLVLGGEFRVENYRIEAPNPDHGETFGGKTLLDLDVACEVFAGGGRLSAGADNLLNIFPDEHQKEADIGSRRLLYSRRVSQFGTKGGFYYGRPSLDLLVDGGGYFGQRGGGRPPVPPVFRNRGNFLAPNLPISFIIRRQHPLQGKRMDMKTTHPFQKFSLAVLALIAGGLMWASPAPAQFDPGGTAGLTAGGSAGGLLPITELENQVALRGTAYLRRGLLPNWQFELNGGFERFLATDSATDVATISGRLLFSPITRSDWNLFLFGGAGLMRYDWDQPEISPLRTPGLKVIDSVPMIPLGGGIQYKLSDNLALEVSVGYEMALSDAVNAVEEGGNDASVQGRVGLTLGSFGPPPVPVAPMPEPVAPPPPVPEPEPPMEEVVEEPEPELPAPRVVLFTLNSAKLSDEAKGILDEVIMDLEGLPELGVLLRGHTDSTGSVWYNSKLGMRRAVAVQKYLIARGIDRGRMSLESRGEDEPVADNATREGRRQNRRVEVIISE